ncbi:phage tail protein [Pectobacterium brasiliense]|uniref:tail fiber protein n=1 Tax=Pectobacterium brasiliense TaxID=180957 RepID=UPI00196927BC|nr:tail fiber protein [Pectobacterium brasiliense]MBN3250573.1 tail fiber protein [Pectobacterium brasiliense]MBN3258324.1 tail fiber protein [Pectobacterium brasiliense]
MANLPEQKTWIDGIYQLETSDPVVGGPGGISNRQAEQLASRTTYLKSEQEKTGSDLATHVGAVDPHTQYAPKASPALTGTPTAPTAAQTANSNQIATTAFVKAAITTLINGSPAALDTLQELANALGNDPDFRTTVLNAIADAKADATNKLNAHASTLDAHPQYAPKASPAFTGTPTAPTAATGSNDTQLATTAFVKAAVAALVNGSPAALDTLQELANALGNDPNFSTTILNALSGKLAKDQNGADISNKKLFAKNASLPYLGSGWVDFGAASGAWSTRQFIDYLDGMGAFSHLYFVCAGTWNYSTNKKIVDTGCGHIELAGAVVEVFADRYYLRTIRVTTMSSSSDPEAVQGQFVYVESDNASGGGWRRDFNTKNLTAADINAIQINELVGIPQPWPLVTVPAGWLACAGQQFNTSLYPILSSRYPTGILPDLRGEFIRGCDFGRGVDIDRSILSLQQDAMRSHKHTITLSHEGGGTSDGVGFPPIDATGPFIVHSESNPDGTSSNTSGAGNPLHSFGGSETRPRNIAFNYIVRAA